MLSFMNSKLRSLAKASKTTFSKKVNPIKYTVQSYILVRTRNLLFIDFTGCIPLYHEIYIKCKKTSNLIKGISSHSICSEIKSQQVKKTICYSASKTFDFSQNY